MMLTDQVLEHVIEYVKPGVAYFPMVWRDSLLCLLLTSKMSKTVVEPFSSDEGMANIRAWNVFVAPGRHYSF